MVCRRVWVAAVLVLVACGGGVDRAGRGPQVSGRSLHPEDRRDMELPPTGRLPEDVAPRAYELSLAVDPTTDRFSGEVVVEVDLRRARDTLWMHADGQRVLVAEVRQGAATFPARWEPVPGPGGLVALRLAAPVGPGRVTITIRFDAPWDAGLEALYRVRSGERWYAFTQFESIRARAAFPCFDEPRFKTPFSVRLTVPEGLVAIANAREEARSRASGGAVTVRFATTPPLPTYLVALAVGPFDVVDAPPLPAADGGAPRPLRGIAPAGRGAELALALQATPPMVAALERALGIAYPYDKLDLIAVPDFRSGAMENAGAITFREQLLLLGPSASAAQRRGFRATLAHELAHMWFGDLVTMAWWDDIWLNEAFASWMGPRVIEELYPADRASEGVVEAGHGAMSADSRAASRVIRQPILSNDDIENAFDSITYSKGAAVLRMFESWAGRDAFGRGIRRYLSEHRHGTATSDDLLAALDAELAGRGIGAAMRTFLDQPGVPLIDVRPTCGPDGLTLDLRQKRHLPLGSAATADVRWRVPVCVRIPGVAEPACTLMTEPEATLRVAAPTCPAWVMPNAGANGYYRFSLPADALVALRSRGWSELDVRERLALADSIVASVSSGSTAIAEALDAALPLASEADRRVASTPMDLLVMIDDAMIDDAQRPRLQTIARDLYRPRLARLGWSARRGESDDSRGDRAQTIAFLALRARDPGVRARAGALGRALVEGGAWHPETADPDLHSTVLAVAVQDGDVAFYDAVLALLRTSEDATVRERLVSALAAPFHDVLAARARALTFDPVLRANEVPSVLWRQATQRETRDSTWAFIRERYVDLLARLARGYQATLPRVPSASCDPQRRAEIEAFFGPRAGALTGGRRNLALALEGIDLCIARRAAQSESARRWLESR